MTSPDISHLRQQWETITVLPPIISDIHPHAGPHGSWLSISLEEPDEPRSWLYFRKGADAFQCAHADDALPPSELIWDDAGDVRAVMTEFAENFQESRAAHVECASPPCSMPS